MFSIYYTLIKVILEEIIPETKVSISKGNKIFGAAILRKKDLSTLIIGTNSETINPLHHGEIVTINKFYDSILSKQINSSECIFLSTHQPCSLCLSAITWSGFNNFYYFFPYSDTQKSFNISHDLKILKEVFNISQGEYNKKNTYWESFSIIEGIKESSYKTIVTLDAFCELHFGCASIDCTEECTGGSTALPNYDPMGYHKKKTDGKNSPEMSDPHK